MLPPEAPIQQLFDNKGLACPLLELYYEDMISCAVLGTEEYGKVKRNNGGDKNDDIAYGYYYNQNKEIAVNTPANVLEHGKDALDLFRQRFPLTEKKKTSQKGDAKKKHWYGDSQTRE